DWLAPGVVSPNTLDWMDQNCTNYPIIVDFHVESTNVPFGTYVKFTNLTLKNPALSTSYLWEFEGVAQSSTSAITSPSRTFNQTGTFPVTLTATNSDMSDSKTIYITVGPNGISSINQESFRIYPNPARNLVNIELDETIPAGSNICIYNMVGEEVISGLIAESRNIQLDVSEFEAGMYFVKVSNEKGSFIQKLSLIK
ncbi:MAG: T9SS type A sorting domain-containing protein, partial [Bacteroidota bacterium]|nr:T9SS type A sorting domain-containing protein [Bacteroidota bacterium]